MNTALKGCARLKEALPFNVAKAMDVSCGRMFLSHYGGFADCK